MFPITDAQTILDLHHLRADELRREAAAYRLGSSAPRAGRHRRLRWAGRQLRAAGASALAADLRPGVAHPRR